MCPASACFNAVDLYSDEHLRQREMIVTVDHAEHGPFTLPGCPVKMSDSPVDFTAAPLLGTAQRRRCSPKRSTSISTRSNSWNGRR